jgi:hypothetical protein
VAHARVNGGVRARKKHLTIIGEAKVKQIVVLCATLIMVHAATAAHIKVSNTDVTFEPPANFKTLSADVMATKWPTNRAPAYAVGNDTASTTVAYDFKGGNLPQDKLSEVQAVFKQAFERMVPGLKWIRNEIVEHERQKWILMEMTSSAIDQDIHNVIFVTGHEGKTLMFNFNSTKKDFPKYEAALRASMKSIKLPK